MLSVLFIEINYPCVAVLVLVHTRIVPPMLHELVHVLEGWVVVAYGVLGMPGSQMEVSNRPLREKKS